MTTIHVKPTADGVAHEDSEDCVCGPTVDPQKLPDGSVNYVVIHHAIGTVVRD